jgi:hypothetical protein
VVEGSVVDGTQRSRLVRVDGPDRRHGNPESSFSLSGRQWLYHTTFNARADYETIAPWQGQFEE